MLCSIMHEEVFLLVDGLLFSNHLKKENSHKEPLGVSKSSGQSERLDKSERQSSEKGCLTH